jgi:hypothetical protein
MGLAGLGEADDRSAGRPGPTGAKYGPVSSGKMCRDFVEATIGVGIIVERIRWRVSKSNLPRDFKNWVAWRDLVGVT